VVVQVSEEDEISHNNDAASSRTRSSKEGMDGSLSSENQKELETNKMNRICDKLIDVFLVEKTNPEEWHIYLAFSKEWVNIRPYFFSRCKSQAAQTQDPKRRSNLLILSRRLKEVCHQCYNGLLGCQVFILIFDCAYNSWAYV
jgi:hypothetical protein